VDLELLRKASVAQLFITAFLTAASAVFWPQGLSGTAAGGLLMTANFYLLRSLLSKVLDPHTQRKVMYAALIAGKFVSVMLIMTWLVVVAQVHPVGMAVGMSSLFGGIFVAIISGTRLSHSAQSMNTQHLN